MRLIDADVLPRHGQRGGLVHWKDIENAPTIDAVEVVRCGQCKHRAFAEYNGAFHLLCERHDGVEVRPNDFCSYGEDLKV